ncbi:MAG TPA: lysylphosphatidylglycerol synthase domain-containing protein [Dehalococcoidia bacterium]|nr:lysylphosphatidylglycerol synthase domain-containing protein [Dehalococcoidia bacterium]
MIATESGATEQPLLARTPQWRLFLGIAASIAALVALARLVDLSDAVDALRLAPDQPLPLVAATLAYTAAFWLRALAWQRLLSKEVGAGRLFSILQASLFLNHLLPLKAGEVARPVLLVGDGVSWPEATSSTVVARLLDFAALVLIAAVALSLTAGSTQQTVALAAGAAVVVLLLLALLLPRRGVTLPLPGALRSRAEQVQTALAAIELRRVVQVAPLVVLSWLLESAMLLAAARLLDIEISLTLAIGATAFTIFFQVVQFTPGGLGLYETSMTSVLALNGVATEDALLLAVITHGLKFAYSFSVGLVFAGSELVGWIKGRAEDRPKKASRFEIMTARAWNVINEGKPFTPVFTLTMLLLLSTPHALDSEHWLRLGVSMVGLLPLALLFFRFDFPLKLRAALWVCLAAFVLLFRFVDLTAVAVVLCAYLTFTVFVWGTVYYHLRMGTRWTNFLRFWRLVLENPDPTSGNLQEQLPKVLLLVFASQYLVGDLSWQAVGAVEAFTVAVGVAALLLHQWLFTWVPALPQPLPRSGEAPDRKSRRFIVIAIDGCRADRMIEANTPFIDSLRREGTDYTDVSTVYPARTVTCFSSMLTGAPAKVHGMRSNFVPSLGVKCDSVFASLERSGLKGRMVGIAHLIDAFGETNVKSVTAVMHNDEIDDALVARAKLVMDEEQPDLLVLQLLSVDQTGHARGSYNQEYLEKIEVTDGIIRDFVAWCRDRGYLDDATVLITADHGQGIGIGGHGHMSPPEIRIPCILWGEGVEAGRTVDEPRFITDIAATICRSLGVEQPGQSVGSSLLPVQPSLVAPGPLVFVIPACNEAENLPSVFAAISHVPVSGKRIVVVDDGSTDATAEVAQAYGAVVVRHECNRGLGAALRSGLAKARELDARAAVYLDADHEYDATEAPALLAPIERGEADFVLGSRFKGSVKGMTPSRRIANRAFSLLLSLLCGRWVSDGQTGFRAFSRRALDVAEIVHDYNYAQVLTLDLLHKGMRMAQVPVSYQRRRAGRSFVSAQYLWRVPKGMLQEMLSD